MELLLQRQLFVLLLLLLLLLVVVPLLLLLTALAPPSGGRGPPRCPPQEHRAVHRRLYGVAAPGGGENSLPYTPVHYRTPTYSAVQYIGVYLSSTV